MPRVGFEPTISAGERPKTYALDRAATGTGHHIIHNPKYQHHLHLLNRALLSEFVGRLVSPFHRPRRPLGRVEVQFYSIFDLGTRRG